MNLILFLLFQFLSCDDHKEPQILIRMTRYLFKLLSITFYPIIPFHCWKLTFFFHFLAGQATTFRFTSDDQFAVGLLQVTREYSFFHQLRIQIFSPTKFFHSFLFESPISQCFEQTRYHSHALCAYRQRRCSNTT